MEVHSTASTVDQIETCATAKAVVRMTAGRPPSRMVDSCPAECHSSRCSGVALPGRRSLTVLV